MKKPLFKGKLNSMPGDSCCSHGTAHYLGGDSVGAWDRTTIPMGLGVVGSQVEVGAARRQLYETIETVLVFVKLMPSPRSRAKMLFAKACEHNCAWRSMA